ncbi:hypothetical protein AB0F45_28395 [Streptomyces achromogenes]|nr:hypothetical protein [Streptomyces sp. UMAF16]
MTDARHLPENQPSAERVHLCASGRAAMAGEMVREPVATLAHRRP